MATMAMCPDCQVLILVRGPLRLRRRLECPECGALLEVSSLQPVRLDFVDEEAGWDEEDLDEFEDDELWDDDEDEDLESPFDEEG